MTEVAALAWNGLVVVTTFAGGGGSSTGYEMAGYRVAWANEFVRAAGDTYAANHPATVLDRRDVRDVTAESILQATGLQAGEVDLFDGSPPCDPFSTAGLREAKWGQVKHYSEERNQRTDDLFFEYIRLCEGLRPRVFVAENVSGLVKGTAKGYFKLILAALRELGYTVEARMLDASWLGVPQARQRIIYQGVRADLAADGYRPAWPAPLPWQYTVRDALPWITAASRNGPGMREELYDAGEPAAAIRGGRAPGVIAEGGDLVMYGRATVAGTEDNKFRTARPDAPAPQVAAGGLGHVGLGQFGIVDGPPAEPGSIVVGRSAGNWAEQRRAVTGPDEPASAITGQNTKRGITDDGTGIVLGPHGV
jgi:DNA (cytosine-5)-methyltransferase 1